MLQRSAGKVTKLIRSQNKLSDIIEKLMKTLALSKVVKKNTYCQNLLWSGCQLEMAV